MKIVDVDTNIRDFLQFVAMKKRKLADWQFLHVVIKDPEKKLQLEEVEQFLTFHIQSDHAWVLKLSSADAFLLFTHKEDSLMLNKFEKAIYEDFPNGLLQARSRGFDSDGLEQFSKIIAPHIKQDDTISRVIFKRMRRPGNSILVLDDDLMVLKQMDKILSGFGNVITLQNDAELDEEYKNNAPDILFLDIHLKSAKGNNLLKLLKKNIDPYAYVVMISSDTKEDIILDIKQGGAKGFLVKPMNRNSLYHHIMKAPTIITKSGT